MTLATVGVRRALGAHRVLARSLSTEAQTQVVEQSMQDMVRQRDYPAYLTHFAYDRALQPHFFALRAFHIELASLKDSVSNELVGRVRMQWWRDAIEGVYNVRRRAYTESPPEAPHCARSRRRRARPSGGGARPAGQGALSRDH